jgi:hypothetical protein
MFAGASQTAAELLRMTFAYKMLMPTREQMKGVIPWLIRWARRAGTIDFYPALAALVSPVKNIFFSHRTLLQFKCPHRPATLASSRAGPPVSECVSPVICNT